MLLKLLKLWVSAGVFFFVHQHIRAQQVVLTLAEDQETYALFGKVSFFEDKQGTLGIDQIVKKEFKPYLKETINFSYSNAVYWFKFQLQNQHKENNKELPNVSNRLLEISYPLLDEIDFYHFNQKNELIRHYKSGDMLPFAERVIPHRYFNFPLEIRDSEPHSFYLKIRSQSPVYAPLKIGSYSVFFKNTLQDELYYGVFMGIFLFVLANTLFTYFALREDAYLIYAFFVLNSFLLNYSLSGNLFRFVLTESGQWQNVFVLVVLHMSNFLSAFFAIRFLSLKKYSVFLDKSLKFFFLLNLFLFLLPFVFPYRVCTQVFQLIALIQLPLLLYCGMFAGNKGLRSARFYVTGYAMFLFFIFFPILKNFGFSHPGILFLVEHGTEMGMTTEVIFLSIALIDRTRQEKRQALREKEKAQQEALELQQQINTTLELKVSERTRQLEDTLEELKLQNEKINLQKTHLTELNQVKDKLFSIISHDLRSPLNSLQGLISVVSAGVVSKEETLRILSKIGDNVMHTTNVLDNLLFWAHTQIRGFKVNYSNFDLKKLVEEMILFLKQNASEKQISIDNQLSEGIFAKADEEMTKIVIRNLINNAIKFTPKNGMIKIYGTKDNQWIQCYVEDNGIGISEEQLPYVFDFSHRKTKRGTDNEKGTGLGLLLCKEFVEKNGGEISCDSKPGEGTIFCFTLKNTSPENQQLHTKQENEKKE